MLGETLTLKYLDFFIWVASDPTKNIRVKQQSMNAHDNIHNKATINEYT